MKKSNRELAKNLRVSQGLVGRKRRQGKTDAQIETEAATAAAKRATSSKTQTSGVESFADAQRRKESALADLRELEHHVKREQLVDVGEMERKWAEVVQIFRDGLLLMPELIAPQLAALSDPLQVRDLLRAEVRKILSDLPNKIRNTGGQSPTHTSQQQQEI